MPDVLLVRHAAALGQAPNAALTEDGERNAEALADVLASQRIDRVISSPFLRATQTIGPFCQRAGLEVEVEPRLAERVLCEHDLPDWRDHLRRSFDDLDYCVGAAESARVAQVRGVQVLKEALAARQRCVLVTHGNLLALLLNSIDPRFGFEGWAGLSSPDLYVVRDTGTSFERLWRGAPARQPTLRNLLTKWA
jgi:2,3-bisphosphoglycerate-dependent phosphoglycerate mutase